MADHDHHAMGHEAPVENNDEHSDHSKHEGHSPEMFRNRFFVSDAMLLRRVDLSVG